ncbi:MAG TPA: UDP-glucose 4-epimerase GalE, partial [Sulfuricurvum sp.]|nr:UDP-glucose 4-epimerase GalE [Sulfuricurvum sp.]
MSKQHILVTGGAGYIGSHVVKQLLEETPHSVTIIDNLSTGHNSTIETLTSMLPDNEKARLSFIKQDLSDFDAVERIFRSNTFDALIHFAASIVVPESVEKPLKYYMNNTVNTTNIIKMCNDYGVGKMIFSSTAAVYGDPTEIPVKETTPLGPINPYGHSKRMSEQVIQDAAAANPEFDYVILRYFNVAGADIKNRIGQSFPNATHLIKVAAQTVTGQRDKMYSFGEDYDTPDGTCIRDYIHVDDLASAHLSALDYLDTAGQKEEKNIFNVGYGHGFSVDEVIETMKKVSGIDFAVERAPRRAGDSAVLISDNSKIKSVLGWTPKYDDLELICRTALAWEETLK